MNPCPDPQGHIWQSHGPTIRAGSTLVSCIREGCNEVGYRIDNQIVEADLGLPGEELF